MYTLHVRIYLSALLERLETRPADVRLAVRAGHVVAARDALDRRLAVRAVFDVAVPRPLLEELLLLLLALRARRALVVLDVAVAADAHETGGALQYGVLWGGTVNLWAVRGGAVEKLGRPSMNVGQERRMGHGRELFGVENLLGDSDGNILSTTTFVTETGQREGAGVDGGYEKVHET